MTPRLAGIQALRALAALLVVVHHANEMWHVRLDPEHVPDFWTGGAAGVDIFFVISGFVMMTSSSQLAHEPGGWKVFVRKRFARIVPYYWLITTIKVASVLALPALALHTVLQPGTVVTSYLFIPWRGPHGEIGPVLPVGWTLNLEMAFYAGFAAVLASGLGILRTILPCLAAAAFLSLAVEPDWPAVAFYCDPVVLDFGAGLCLGRVSLRHRCLGPVTSSVAIVAGLSAILLIPPVLPRLLSWGVPAVLIVAGALGLESPMRRRVPAGLLRLGDASYSIYLTHGFCLALLGAVLQRLAPSATAAATVTVGSVLCAVVGLAAYRFVEKPLLEAFGRSDRLTPPDRLGCTASDSQVPGEPSSSQA